MVDFLREMALGLWSFITTNILVVVLFGYPAYCFWKALDDRKKEPDDRKISYDALVGCLGFLLLVAGIFIYNGRNSHQDFKEICSLHEQLLKKHMKPDDDFDTIKDDEWNYICHPEEYEHDTLE